MNPKISDKFATVIFVGIALFFVILVTSLISYILVQGFPSLSMEFLTTESSVVSAGGGIRDQLFNSYYLLFITMVITVPLGVLGGVYMAKYAKEGKITDFIRTCIELLASLPSIVVGMFGLLLFVNTTGWGFSIIGGALALTIFNIPVMVRVTEDAFRAVNPDQNEASLALGMTKWHTIKTIILPVAFPSILSGIILASGRIFGEAAALLFTAGLSTPSLDYMNWNPFAASSPLNIFRPAETLAVHIWAVNTNGIMPDIDRVAMGASAILILSVLGFNIFARIVGRVIQRKLTASKK